MLQHRAHVCVLLKKVSYHQEEGNETPCTNKNNFITYQTDLVQQLLTLAEL